MENKSRRVWVRYEADGETRETFVTLTPGYSDESSIPRIIAVSRWSSNAPEYTDRIKIIKTKTVPWTHRGIRTDKLR